MPMAHAREDLFRQHALTMFRSVMPGVAGVVLAGPEGRALAHDLPGETEAQSIAEGAERPAKGASTLVEHSGSLYLVVFVPADVAGDLQREPLGTRVALA